MNNNYARAYVEVLEILSYLTEEEYNKIPKEKIEFYEMNKDIDYIFKINPNVDLAEQNISIEANSILVSLFREFFATDSQKVVLDNLLVQNQQKAEQQKREKYSPDDIFKKNKEDNRNIVEAEKEMLPVKIEEEKWYIKILNFFRSIFRK